MPQSANQKLVFQPSDLGTIGFELELPIVHRTTRELASGSPRLLEACRAEGIEDVSAELMQSMLEVRTGVCRRVRDVHVEIVEKLRGVRNIANSMRYDLALLASHPSAETNEHVLFPDESYAKASGRMAWLIYHRVTFGLHVHIGVRSGDEAIGVTNMLVQYLPHLIAVAANSPFWQGIDSGLATVRCALYGIVTHAGVPRYFSAWRDFRNYMRTMMDCGAIPSVADIKWDIRPRPDLGTIEFRVCDTPATLRQALALTALIRSLCISTARLLDERPHVRRGDIRRQWITEENKWLATRYGLDAPYIRTPAGKRGQLRHELRELITGMEPVARETGDINYLRHLVSVESLTNGAERQRRVYRDEGRWEPVVDDAVSRLNRDLEESVAK